jgi:hypothetical protein
VAQTDRQTERKEGRNCIYVVSVTEKKKTK